MADEKYLTETLRYYTEVFRLTWLSILGIGGGAIGLLLGERSVVRVVLALAGIFSVGVLLEVLRRLDRQIGIFLKRLLEVKNA